MQKIPLLSARSWRLYRAISSSIVNAFLFKNPIIKAILHAAMSPFITNLTYHALEMESIIEHEGHMQGASAYVIDKGARGVHVHDANRVPENRPVLFVANHAGLSDANALLMSSPRRDTHTLVFDDGILRGLEAFHKLMIPIDKENPTLALRDTIKLLRAGQSILMFPAGEIEGDPALYLDDTLESLNTWSTSIEFFARHVPDLQVVPAGIGGVISRTALQNPIVKQYKTQSDRLFLAATFQLAFPAYRNPQLSIFYGQPLCGSDITMENVRSQMQTLIRKVHEEQTEIFGDDQSIHN
jgi:hypothetical protein